MSNAPVDDLDGDEIFICLGCDYVPLYDLRINGTEISQAGAAEGSQGMSSLTESEGYKKALKEGEDAIAITSKILTPEQFGNILWPGMFPEGWREIDPSNTMQQARFYCLEKSEKILRVIEVRMK